MKSILEFAGIAAVITGSISLVGILVGLWFNYRENRTNRYVQIITRQTLENTMFIRENSEIVTVLTRPAIIDDARANHDTDYKRTLMRAEVNIEHQFKYCISQEKPMIETLRELVKDAFEYYDSPSNETKIKLLKNGEKYYKMMTIYDYADWLYIKEQAKSRAYNKQYTDYDAIYNELAADSFHDKDIPKPWSEEITK